MTRVSIIPGLLFAAVLLFAAQMLVATELVVNTTLELIPEKTQYRISVSPIIQGSEVVSCDSLFLIAGLDYRLDAHTGIISLLRFPTGNNLNIQFILIPLELIDPFYDYQVVVPSDSLLSTLSPRKRNILSDDGKLLISGSKTFAITFSEDSAFDLKQSLFVNLNGELSPNVNIAAQLSDSQSKLTPEGDSKELSSLDKVFIRVYGKQYEIAMGDLNWEFSGTKYINYATNIEGLNAWYKDRHMLQAGYTAASGKPALQKISIIDGKQGPYYLNPTGYQSTYIIIAGSEKLYLDGRLLERSTDYSIDYAEGSVMFRILVTSTNAINAYFQYSDDYYKQATYFNSSRFELLPGLSLEHHFIHQADARDNPLLYDFTEADLDSLNAAGDRIAWGNGIVQVAPGQGSYLLKLTSEGVEYYEYAETDTTASYNVTFSYVGSGYGDYEEYSNGKYRYLGANLGAWLPQKRLIPPVKHSNADLLLRYENKGITLGAEAIYTADDKNTLSAHDDTDNRSGIVSAFGLWRLGEINKDSWLKLDYEKRWANSYLFTQSDNLGQDYDLVSIAEADSLNQSAVEFSMGSNRWTAWKPELLLRWNDIPGSHTQKALRLVSRSLGKGILPALDWRSTLNLREYYNPHFSGSLQQYHDLASSWDLRWFKAKMLLNYNSLEYDVPSLSAPSSRYLKLNPQLSIGDAKITQSQLSFATDDAALKITDWESVSRSQTYSLKHTTNTLNHTLNLDFTHREIQKSGDNPKSNYNLLSFRNSHYLLKQAVMLLGNYQLNHTEFFPKIRELEYIGEGLGLYDSTGVYTPDGDFDYVYITSDEGTLSAELNAQLSLYLKPGNIAPAWKWIHSDIILQGTEQSLDLSDWRSYIFYPGTVFNEQNTIFGKQSLSQTLWLEIVTNRILGSLFWQYDRSLDNRYQSMTHTTGKNGGFELDFKQFGGNNYNARLELENEQDSRYMSDISQQTAELLVQRNLDTSSLVKLRLSVFRENGSNQNDEQDYTLLGGGIEPEYRGIWGKKGRLTGSLGLRYNKRSGSDFLTFLPEKREGFLFNWSFSAIYRLNSYSSASFEYSGNIYPEDKARHTLKLEFKAEL